MIGKSIDIPTVDGIMDAYLAHPGGDGPYPLVVLFMDIWGLREELFGIARDVAGHGYAAVVPNLFYRHGKVRYERRNAAGKMVSFDTLPVELQTEMQKLGRGIDRAMVRIDVGAIFDYCRTEPVDAGAAGAIGFCLGGRIAFLAGQEFPGRIRAVASLHGTLLVTDAEDSPHRRAYLMRGEVYCGHAEHDRFSEPSILAALAAPLEGRADLTYRQRFHAGAHHGYSMPDRDVHDATATAADWREIYAMLGRQLQAAR